MTDKELFQISEETSKILAESDNGLDDVVTLIKVLVLTIKEKNFKIIELESKLSENKVSL